MTVAREEDRDYRQRQVRKRREDRRRLSAAWTRFLKLEQARKDADRTGRYSDAALLEQAERRAHANLGFLQHELGLDE
jgi:hypothetical protein